MAFIYLDHAATTPVHPNVLEAMMEVYKNEFGNPSSIHQAGRKAKTIIDEGREIIARAIGATPKEIIFTGGGTESDNMAIIGAARANRTKGKHIITTKIEHHAVLNTCQFLEKDGFEVTYLDVDARGRVSLEALKKALREDTILVTIIYGNNEVGTLQPIREIAFALQDHQAYFHTDAVQAFGTVHLDVQETPIDLLSISAHKINGPKGVGALYIKDKTSLEAVLHGGEQERKRRAGTQNVPGIAGLSAAVEESQKTLPSRISTYLNYRKLVLETLDQLGTLYYLNGDPEHFLPHIVNLYFPGVSIESLLMNLDLSGVAVSSGSACTAGSVEPSHVLAAMFGSGDDRAKSSLRISFGYGLTNDAVAEAAQKISETVNRLQK